MEALFIRKYWRKEKIRPKNSICENKISKDNFIEFEYLDLMLTNFTDYFDEYI